MHLAELQRVAPGAAGRVRAATIRSSAALHVGALLGAVALWAGSLPATNLRAMNDLGLVSVLSPAYYAALALLTVSFCIAVRSRERHWVLLAAHVVVLLVMLHGTPAILSGTLRYSWAWKHVGIVDYIVRHGSVNPNIEGALLPFGYVPSSSLSAYQDWPGFFALVALIVKVGGVGSALPFAPWAPLLNNLLFAAAVMFVVRSFTTDRRLAWMAVWIFCAVNWVGQDYFSPQATAYFLYLVVIGICLRWLRPLVDPSLEGVRRWVRSERLAALTQTVIARARREGPGAVFHAGRAALVVLVLVLEVAIVPTHQLTPFMLILSLTGLVVVQLCVLRGLPLLVALLTASWAAYMAVGFLKGNLYWIVASIGSLNVGGSTLANLAKASPDQVLAADTARGLTLFVAALATAGLIRRARQGHADLAPVVLACAPVLMVWGNAYGGEVLYRVYFFALPFLAFLAAGLVFPAAQRGGTRLGSLAAAALCVPLMAGMLIVYYGKERMDYFSHDEVRASEYLYSHAPAGSMFIAGTGNYPWAFRNYERHSYVALSEQRPPVISRVLASPAPELARLIAAGHTGRGYLIITRSQVADAEMNGVLPAGGLARVEKSVERSPSFREIYRGPDAQIFAFLPSGART